MPRVTHRRRPGGWRLAGAAVAGVVAVAAVALTGDAPGSDPSGRLEPPAPSERSRRAAPVGSAVPDSASERWARVLQVLDRRRARAFAAGDAAALTTVYERGSAVLARDRAMLAAYAGRGLTVQGAGLRLLDVRLSRFAAGGVVLRVVDRLGPAAALTASGVAVSLPRDRPTVHRLVLHRRDGRWRIAAVAAASG